LITVLETHLHTDERTMNGHSDSAMTQIREAAHRRLVATGLRPGARVLDAPCGAGQLTKALISAGLDCHGADVDDQARNALGDRFQVADLDATLPWADGYFDAVVSVEGIEHLENRYGFLREMHRLLRPGGILLITTPNTVSLRSRVRFWGSGFYHKDPRPLLESDRHPLQHIGLATFPELRHALHTTGFRLELVSHTHVKHVSYVYSVYIPWMWLYTRIAFRREKNPAQRAHNREILATMFSKSLLWGENLLLLARRI
jgi:SAM-dependent methyltransferase